MANCYCVSLLGDGVCACVCVVMDLSVEPPTLGCGSHKSRCSRTETEGESTEH